MERTKTSESEVESWLAELYPEKRDPVKSVELPVIEEDVPESVYGTNRVRQPVSTSASKIDDALRRRLRKKKQFDAERHALSTWPRRPNAVSGQVNAGSDDDCDSRVGAIKKSRNLGNSVTQTVKTTDTKHLSKSAKRRLKKRLEKDKIDT